MTFMHNLCITNTNGISGNCKKKKQHKPTNERKTLTLHNIRMNNALEKHC